MNQPSEEARYLASYLFLHYSFVNDHPINGEETLLNFENEEELAEAIEEYFNSRC